MPLSNVKANFAGLASKASSDSASHVPGVWVKTRRVQPRARLLIESMRDIGYSLDTALADVVDNSIAAGATSVSILANTAPPDVRIGILDNGSGMTFDELMDAMRPGSRSPLDDRSTTDLGRFGLGLKTASFSQCRRLTVISRRDGVTSAARWDLDMVAETDDWVIELPEDLAEVPWVDRLGRHGTLILWEKPDRLIDATGTSDRATVLDTRISDAASHLELVFHRYLSGERAQRRGDRALQRLRIDLNGRQLEPFDPFFQAHSATICGPVETIGVGGEEILLQTFTLPHHSKVTPAEWERHAGRGGYARNQGFYVYREKRLIIHGTWFGLARQTELTRLARVRIDLTNRLDSFWKIDVRKASAQPPQAVRERLRSIIERIGASSKRVYTARGNRLADQALLPVWCRTRSNTGVTYGVNSEHPLIRDFRERLEGSSLAAEFDRLLEGIGAALPMDALFADLAGEPDSVRGQHASEETLRHLVEITAAILRSNGISIDNIRTMMRVAEPFRSGWELAERYLDELLMEDRQ